MNFIKVKKYDGEKIRYLQHKLDGHAVQIVFNNLGLKVLTRTPGVDLWPKLINLNLAKPLKKLPRNTVIFGELFGRGQATNVKTLINEKSDDLSFTAFAMPRLAKQYLEKEPLHVINSLFVELGFSYPTTKYYEGLKRISLEIVKERALSQGIEGFVAKEEHFSGWYKIKPTKTVDCKVLSTMVSTSESQAGGLKSIMVAVIKGDRWHVIASVGGGFDLEYRLSVDRKSLNGRIAEIEYDGLAANGKLKFPRFIRWRDDKPANECTYEQLL